MEKTNNRIQLNRSVDMASPEKAANVFTPPNKDFLRREVPWSTEASQALYSESVCYLVVPADEEVKMQLLQEIESKDVSTRANAATCLAVYPGKDTIEILRSLLTDEGTSILNWRVENNQLIRLTIYPVRQAAYYALKRLGIEVEKPEGFDGRLTEDYFN